MKMTEKGQDFVWGQDQDAAWRELKKRLVTAPVLAYPDPKKPYVPDTDPSGVGIRAVLTQVQDGKERGIANGSSTMMMEVRRSSMNRRKQLAMMHFVKQCKYYLYTQTFFIRTDHGTLQWLMSFRTSKVKWRYGWMFWAPKTMRISTGRC